MEKEKKDPHLSDEVVKLQKHRIMLWCAIIIIAFFLIVQFSVANCENEVLADQFTFASTISSIILSVIAIIMSVVSSDSINSLLHRFRDLHDEISDVPEKIDLSVNFMNKVYNQSEDIYNELKDVPQNIGKSTLLIENASEKIGDSITSLHEVIEELKTKTDSIVSWKDELKSEIRKGFSSTTDVNGENDANMDKDKIYKSILDKGSYWGNSMLYAAIMAHDKKCIFDLNIFCKTVTGDLRHLDYYFGYMIFAIASTIIEVRRQNDYRYYIDAVNCTKEDLKEVMSNFIIKYNVDKSDIDNDMVLNKIEHLFD